MPKIDYNNINVKKVLKKRNSKKSVQARKEQDEMHGVWTGKGRDKYGKTIPTTKEESAEYQKRIAKMFSGEFFR